MAKGYNSNFSFSSFNAFANDYFFPFVSPSIAADSFS